MPALGSTLKTMSYVGPSRYRGRRCNSAAGYQLLGSNDCVTRKRSAQTLHIAIVAFTAQDEFITRANGIAFAGKSHARFTEEFA